jgi:hypothetical protein
VPFRRLRSLKKRAKPAPSLTRSGLHPSSVLARLDRPRNPQIFNMDDDDADYMQDVTPYYAQISSSLLTDALPYQDDFIYSDGDDPIDDPEDGIDLENMYYIAKGEGS